MIEDILKYSDEIKDRIGEKRFLHTLRVKDTAIELAKIYSVDEDKAAVAGLLHDCAKIRDVNLLKEEAQENGLKVEGDFEKAPQIIHSYLGSLFAEKLYNVHDEDILNAIKYHTTGRENMSSLEKIIFLADSIEPMRNFDGVIKLRELSYKDLDEAMYFSLNSTIKMLAEKNIYIVPETLYARNFYREMVNWNLFLRPFWALFS